MSRGLTAGQRAELWQRWKTGQSLSDIGLALGKPSGSVFGYLASRGGIPPAARCRSPRALTRAEREELSRRLSAGASLRSIAAALTRPQSTVSREVSRKWTHYFPIYERHFSSLRNKSITFLEIGVNRGGSLRMWQRYFGPLARIIGIDINERCKEHEEPGIAVRIGDQGDEKFLQGVRVWH